MVECVLAFYQFSSFVGWDDAFQVYLFLGAFFYIILVVCWPDCADFLRVGEVEDFGFGSQRVFVDCFDAVESFEVLDARVSGLAFEAFELRKGFFECFGFLVEIVCDDFRIGGGEVFNFLFCEC